MKDMLCHSVFFGVMISVLAYELGMVLKKKFKLAIFNPLMISVVVVIIILCALNIDYDTYYEGSKYLSYLLTPTTVCLAIPLYEQLTALRRNAAAILAGITAGVLTSLSSVLTLSMLFHLNHQQYVTILPKSITTAIGMVVSEEMGGIATITVAIILVTGVIGSVISDFTCKIFRITHPVAKGIALGSSAHAIGTVKALELGEVEGAMSSLSIAVSGLITVVAVPIFASFL